MRFASLGASRMIKPNISNIEGLAEEIRKVRIILSFFNKILFNF